MAQADVVRNYLDALSELENSEGMVDSIGQTILSAGKALSGGPYSFYISGKDRFPPEAATGRRYTFFPENWPSAQQIEEALVSMFKARMKVAQLWNKVPDSDKKGLKAPPPTRS